MKYFIISGTRNEDCIHFVRLLGGGLKQLKIVICYPFRCNSSALKMSDTAGNRPKNSLKTPILEVQGHSKSSTLTPIKSLSLLLVMISSTPVPICNRFHAI